MKIFGTEFKFNGFDIFHKGNFNPDSKADASILTSHLSETSSKFNAMMILITNYSNLVEGDDWTNAIQQAVNDATETQEIHFPVGEYNFSGVTVNKPIRITGKGTLKKNNQGNKLFIIDFDTPYIHIWNTFDVRDVTIDGNEQGYIGFEELFISNIGFLKLTNVKFKNPSKCSVRPYANVHKVTIQECEFEDGMYFSGNSGTTTTLHIYNSAACYLSVEECKFETSIIYDGGNGTQNGVIKASPIAIYSENALEAIVKNNRSINAGHIDLYTLNHKCTVFGNKFVNCHHPAIKVQESKDTIISQNTIRDSLCSWAYCINVQGYARASSYGSLAPEQYYGIITDNVIDGSLSGGILVSGTPYSTAISDRDPSITTDLIVYGYLISGNTIKNVKLSGLYLGYAAECKINNNYIKNFGLSTTAANLNRSGITIQKPKGLIDIFNNHIIGDGTNAKFGVVHDNTGLSAIVTSSRLKLHSNFIKGSTLYQVYFQYIESVDIRNNTISDDVTTLIKVDYATEAYIFDNTGFDLSNANKMQLSNIQYLQTDYRKKARNIIYVTAMPTTGSYVQDDYAVNVNKAILGTAGSRYVIKGWIRITTSSNNVLNTDWVEDKVLTGT